MRDLVQLLLTRAQEQPEQVVYTFLRDGEVEEAAFRCVDLDRRARAIAATLQQLSGAGERALLLFPSGLELIVAFFGCLYAGVVAVPSYPPSRRRLEPRIRAIARDAQVRFVLTTNALLSQRERIAAEGDELAGATWIATDRVAEDLAAEWREIAPGGSALAFLQYTSGSTAEPRGVLVTHGNLLHNSELIRQAFGQIAESVVVGWLPLHHDMGLIGNVLQPLYCGARAILMSPLAFLQRPSRWLQAISRYRATTSGGPNFAYDLCARKISAAVRADLDLTSWRLAFNGAEPVRATTLDRFVEVFAPCGFRRSAFYPCYGLAEATLFVAGGDRLAEPTLGSFDVRALAEDRVAARCGEGPDRRQVGCGGAWGGQRIAIVEPKTGVPCRADQVGEIWVAGLSIAGAYWNRPEESARQFAALLADGSGPYLRTGDLGFVQEGELFVTGRLKDLLLIRGSNHYPQDLEFSAEASHPALRPGGSAAFAVEADGEEGAVLVCEVEPRVEGLADGEIRGIADAVRGAIAEEHEIQVWEVVLIPAGTLPKTTSGKVQRGVCRAAYLAEKLVAVSRSRAERSASSEEEAGLDRTRLFRLAPGERLPALLSWLRGAAARSCRVSPGALSPARPLTESGLDSLAAVEIQQQVEGAFGSDLSLAGLLRGSTLHELAEELLHSLADTGGERTPASLPSGGDSVVPLTPGQRALWFLDRLSPESAAYNLAAAARVHGELDVSALRGALADLAERHPVLGSRFEVVENRPRQRLSPPAAVRLELADAASWSSERTAARLVAAARRPLDLETGPPFRLLLLAHSPREHALLLVVHHLVCDFWSLVVLLADLETFYRLRTGASEDRPAPLQATYADFVRWQDRLLASPRGSELAAFWERQLAGPLPSLALPTDRPRPAVQTYGGGSAPVELAPAEAAGLSHLCRTLGATLFMGLLAAFEILLHRLSGQREILVGTPTSGRSAAAWAGLVGYFVNPVVLRADLGGSPGFAGYLARRRAAILAAYEHQEFPFALLAERLQPERDSSRPPLFQVLFALQKAQRPELSLLAGFALGEGRARMPWAGLELESLRLGWRPAPFDLTLAMAAEGSDLAGSLQYNTDLFDSTTAVRLAGHFATLVQGILGDPELPIDALPLLTYGESGQVLREWNDTGLELSGEVWIHRAVERQAAARPEAIALVCGEESASYRELDRRANRLAHRLRALGVRPEARVGVCLERALDLVVALLAILKAGGAYVPLDLTYPRERLDCSLADADVQVLLTRERWARAFRSPARVVLLDAEWAALAQESTAALSAPDLPDALAYLIYTSGSTGTPKGVMVSHRNVANFFAAMDRCLGAEPGCWLALTSVSFDISVLELLWTLARGFRVVMPPAVEEPEAVAGLAPEAWAAPARPLAFSLFYFAGDEGGAGRGEATKYRLLLDGARFADRHGFAAVWTPERHFHAFGGLYPNPSVTGAAVAAVTERVAIRAGSVVLPLHHPVRVAEEWAVVDNLSGGRVGISFASGWNAADFVFAPASYGARKETLAAQIDVVRRLWRGEAMWFPAGEGETEIRILPRPLQPELPFWLTAAGSPETFRLAGEMGANLLTHLLGQGIRELAPRIALYRKAWNAAGHPGEGAVTLMLHTFVGADAAEVREVVKRPFTDYLASSLDLMKVLAPGQDLTGFSAEDRRALLARAFDRYFETSGLFGPPEACRERALELAGVGVDEIACLIDFGVPDEAVMQSLERLAAVRASCQPGPAPGAARPARPAVTEPLSELLLRHGATHLQCTPSAATALLADPAAPAALARLRLLLVGGEALPPTLAERLHDALGGTALLNMYGPTETTIWSAVGRVAEGEPVTLGRPIANTELRLADERLELVAVGRPGELLVGGAGVVRGYWGRPEQTAERFIPDPWGDRPGGRLYRTGDLARWLPDGRPVFLGRRDHQVKVRGHRIELGEIEATLARHPAVREAAVLLREDTPGDPRLVAYLVAAGSPLDLPALRAHAQEKLPQAMWPAAYVMLAALPLTPNGKVDRRALPAPDGRRAASERRYVAPRGEIQEALAKIWRELLRLDEVSIHDNFFEVGGNSLLLVEAHGRLRRLLRRELPLVELMRHPTIDSLAHRVEEQARDVAGPAPELPALRREPAARYEPFPLTDVQQAYWLGRSGTLVLGRVSCHFYSEMDFQELDPHRFAAAWRRLVARHDMLRAVFLPDGRQRVLAEVPEYVVQILDLRGEPPEQVEGRLRDVREELSHQLLPADRWPLFDLRLSLLPGGSARLHVSFDLLIADGWSSQVLERELLQLYFDPAVELPPLEITFRDYVLTLSALEETELWRASREYWVARLATLPPPPDLPLAKAPEAAGAGRFVRRSGGLSPADWQRLEERAGQAGLTPSAVLLTAYAEVLATWSRRRRFSLVLTLFHRLAFHPQVLGLVGDFTSLTFLAIDATGRVGFVERARQVQRRLLEDLDHRFYSSVRVVRDLIQTQGWSARSALPVVFTSTLTGGETLVPPAALRPVRVWSLTQTPQVLVDQQVCETLDGGLDVAWDAVEELFPPGLLDDLFGAYLRLLDWLCTAPDWSAPAPGLVPAEQLARHAAANATAAPLPGGLLHDGFREKAWLRPDSVAVLTPGETLTYGELDRRASRLGRRLQELGAQPGRRVGIVLDKGWEQVAAVLGVLTAGAAFLPLDPDLPPARLQRLLERGGVDLVVTREGLDRRLDWPPSVRRLALDRADGWDRDREDGEPLAPAPTTGDLAYVLFTSGSTGEPKGVAIDHRSARNTVLDVNRRFGIGPSDRVLALSALHFDLSVWDLFGLLTAGGALVMPSSEGRREPAHWLERMAAGPVTVWNTVPALLQMLLDWSEGREIAVPGGALRLALLSGDWIPTRLPDRARAWIEKLQVISLGGATEASIWSILFPIGAVDPTWASIPYGRPMDNQTFHVLDEGLGPVPDWVPGELYIGGAGLAWGYWGDAPQTAERFLPHPETGERLYRTGDLGRWLPGDHLEFLGREDLQVKIRGHRIELGEIEAALALCPGVRAAAVTVAGDPQGERRLVGHVVPTRGSAPREGDLRVFLAARLPSAMVPSTFLLWEEMPLTANAKIDRGRLAAAGEGERRRDTYKAPRDPLEESLAGIWAEVLGSERIGIHDDLFDLGAHSLLATQLLARVNRTFAVELPLQSIFENPSVAGLAVELRRHLALAGSREALGTEAAPTVGPPPLLPLSAEHAADPVPLSFAQERLWFLDRLEPGSQAYHIAGALHLAGRLDLGTLQAALAAIVERHAALRTTFAGEGGRPFQVVARPGEEAGRPLSEIDLSGLAAARESEAERLSRAEAGRPFDLARGPLVRAVLLSLAPAVHRLVLTVHHIVADGWSLSLLFRELGVLYAAFAEGLPSPLPPLPIQYPDFTLWQRGWLRGEVLAQEIAWWRRTLAALSPLDLPADRDRPAARSQRGARHRFTLPADLAAGLARRARAQGATLFMVLLGGLAGLLARITGSEDLAVGSVVANRRHRELEGLVGFLVNTLVLRIDAAGDPDVSGLLGRVRAVCLDGYEHQDLPFEKLVEGLAPERDPGRTPFFQVMLTLDRVPAAPPALPGLQLTSEEIFLETAKFDLTVRFAETEEGLAGTLEYRRDLFAAPAILRLAGHLATLLSALAGHGDTRLSELPLLREAERAELLREWNDTGVESRWEGPVHEQVVRQARRAPDATALVSEAGTLSYGEMARRAERLAARLADLAVGAEVPVAICVERSAELVLGALAVLQAGGSYVPLDPAYPPDRLDLLLADLGRPQVLSRRADLPRLPPGVSPLLLDAERSCPPAGTDLSALGAMSGTGAGPRNRAYLIYTSGSTGRPKGVEVEHGSLANLVSWHVRTYGLQPEDRATLVAGPAFDASVWEIWPILASGGSLAIPGEELRSAPDRLARWLVEREITVSFLPTPLAEAVLAEPWAAGGALRALWTGGDRLRRAPRLDPGFGLFNHYGPTESTVVATQGRVEPGTAGLPTLGSPIANTRLYLLDVWGNPVPPGATGEVCLGGLGLARGYWRRPELTAASFVPDPFSTLPGARLYRTGDLARQRASGELDFLGRADSQVKLRGVRIEPGEIESALIEHPGVRDAAVLLQHGDGGRLIACVTPAVPETPAPSSASAASAAPGAELRRFLLERLPVALVPAAFVALPALPFTPNGKVDRRALARLADEAGRAAGPEARPPATVTEILLAGIWEDLLPVARVGADDSFFALGGHSLLAAQVVSRVREIFAVELPLERLFAAPTLAALARVVADLGERRTGEVGTLPLPRRARREGSERPPLSFAQERLWFLDQLDPGSPAYNVPGVLALSGRLQPAALRAALVEVAQRHEALRTTFVAAAGRPMQAVAAETDLALPMVDLAELPHAGRRSEALRLARAESRRVFALSRGPLLRCTLLRLAGPEPQKHWVLFTLHHIVADGWSVGLLVEEMGALYSAFVAGRPSPLPELPVQYADFAVWQREWLTGEVLATQLAFWRRALAGLPPLDLPTDRPRPPVRSTRGAAVRFGVGVPLVQELARLCRAAGATLFMALLGVFAGGLSRLTGQADVALGSPVANRTRREIERLIGFFVNTLVLRADLAGAPSFRALLGQVRQTALAAFTHQDLPFEKLVEALAPERDPSRTPLFQAMFALQNAPQGELALPGLSLAPVEIEWGMAKFDLTLSFQEVPEGLLGRLEFNRDLFAETTVRRLSGHLATLLAGAVATPEARLSELSLLSAPERQQLLLEWSRGAGDFPGEGLLHGLVREQAVRRPEGVAVVDGTGALTYGELERRALALAGRLRELGVGPESVVGIYAERSFSLVIGLLGILTAGGAYLPLDPALPEERLGFLLDDGGAKVLVTPGDPPLPPALLRDGRQEIRIDSPADGGPRQERRDLSPEPQASNAAYVIYTSGSTGKPKGVVIPHQAVVERTRYGVQHDIAAGDRVLQRTTISFDVSVFEIFGPLAAGCTLVLARPGGDPDADDLLDLLLRQEVTYVSLPPSLLAALLDRRAFRELASLRFLVTGGEAVPADLPDRFRAVHSAGLVNRYGPTETTISITSWRPASRERTGTLPIGRPIAGALISLFDPDLAPVPAGAVGELCVSGVHLARGYLGRPELTAERFVPEPFGHRQGGRLYRSGDLVRQRPDGMLEFVGRRDRQVKIRGFRVELGEVEAALAACPGVREAVVVDHPDRFTGSRLLVAYAVPAESREADPAPALRSWLAERLPAYLVPSAFVFLSRFPLLPSGKVDRRALPEPVPERAPYVAPRTPIEEGVAGLFADLLEVERVGAEDDFFALGGHSLLATRLASRLRQAFGVELPLRRLFERPAVAGLATAISEELAGGDSSPVAPPLVPLRLAAPRPLSFAQERLWFLDRLDPGSAAYHIPVALRLRGRLATRALAASLAEIVRRHAVLRTILPAADGTPVQVVAPAAGLVLPRADLLGLPAPARATEGERLARDEARAPFDLGRGPLFRARLVQLGEEEHLLLVTMHHIVADGWSMGVLVGELRELYRAFLAGRPSPLPELPVQYGDYAVWQRGWLAGEVLARQLASWRETLAGLPPLDLPTDRPRPVRRRGAGSLLLLHLPRSLTLALAHRARAQGGTLFMALAAGLLALLARHAGQEDLALGSPVANRRPLEVERLIGFFVNTLVLRADLTGDPTFTALLSRAQDRVLAAFTHADVPFEKVVEAVAPERDTSRTPLFQVLLALQTAAFAPLELPGLTLELLELPGETAKYDLTLSLRETAAGLSGAWEYDRDLFDPTTVDRLSGGLARLLAAAAAQPDFPLSALPLLGPGERQQLLAEWNDAPGPAWPSRCLQDAVVAQARRTPEAVALVWGGERLTYGALLSRARRLARRLQDRGVGPEVRVGVCAGRSPDLVAALLGVLLAGGAYVPLDPSYPRRRLELMLADSGAALALAGPDLASRLPAEGTPVLDLADLLAPGPEAVASGVAAENLAYLIYTSGSTGRPKGVAIEHRSAAALVAWASRAFRPEELQGVLAATSVSFDLSVFELFVPLCLGGRVVLVDNALSLSTTAAAWEVSLVNTVPSALRELVRAAPLPGSVRTVNLAGEPLSRALAESVHRQGPRRLLNLYGPSEDTTYSTFSEVALPPRREPAIGRPLAGGRGHVVDLSGELVPLGAVGELLLGGIGLARGYLGQPDRTAERFVPDPWSGEPGARLYRTGDRVRWLPEGQLVFLGRLDHQVKVHGFRIELGELEAVLLAHPGVLAAAVLAREDRPGDRRLVAYVVGKAGEARLPGGLVSYLTERLPAHLIPAAFVPLPALPLTPGGKVDRRALPAPDWRPAEAPVAPRTALEEVLAEAFAEILGLSGIGVRDSFFRAGGHSLLATQLLSRVQTLFRTELPLDRLFAAPTVEGLAAAILDRETPLGQSEKIARALLHVKGSRKPAQPARAASAEGVPSP